METVDSFGPVLLACRRIQIYYITSYYFLVGQVASSMPAVRVRSLHCPDRKGKLDKMTDAKTCDCGETAGTDLIGAMKISQLSSWTGINYSHHVLYLPSKGTSARFLSAQPGLVFITSTSISHILQTYTKRPGRLAWNLLLRSRYLII